MNKYELMYIVSSDANDQELEKIIKTFSDMVTKSGGTVDSLENKGLKKFAYPINYKNEGYYVIMNFTSEPDLPRKMEEQMRITEHFVRKMFIRK